MTENDPGLFDADADAVLELLQNGRVFRPTRDGDTLIFDVVRNTKTARLRSRATRPSDRPHGSTLAVAIG